MTISAPQMSSGEDRTHHWLLTSPGPGEAVVEEDPMVEEDPPAPLHYPLAPPGEDPLAVTPSDAPGEFLAPILQGLIFVSTVVFMLVTCTKLGTNHRLPD